MSMCPPGGTRHTFQCLEDQLIYLADLLTLIQSGWAVRKPDQPSLEQQRHRLLARYGHASHAVEDFFFHSNFVEMAWAKAFPDQAKKLPLRQQRILQRRMRRPKAENDVLSRSESIEAGPVYTGYFAANDVFHTLIGGLSESMEHAQQDQDSKKIALLTMLSSMFTEGDENSQADKLKRYRDTASRSAKRTWPRVRSMAKFTSTSRR